MTSAATPAFHASPAAVENAESRYGFTAGKYIFLSCFFIGTANAREASSKSGSALLSPVLTFDHTNGITIRAEINDGTNVDFIHTRARIINEATGVALIICRSGEKNVCAFFEKNVIKPGRIPIMHPRMNPTAIRISV